MAGGAFDKDFSYLMPFLDKVAAAASSLENSGAREELRQLMAGEKQRWERIRELLNRTSSVSIRPAQGAVTQEASASNASISQAPENDVRMPPAFTVGSLRHNG